MTKHAKKRERTIGGKRRGGVFVKAILAFIFGCVFEKEKKLSNFCCCFLPLSRGEGEDVKQTL